MSASAATRRGLLMAGGFLLAGGFPAPSAGAWDSPAPRGEPIPGVSKEMGLAIEHYEKGEDLDAMDRFMDVLTNGDPAERPMANEYINLISQRMALGSGAVNRPPVGASSMESIRSEGYTALGLRPSVTLERAGGIRSAPPEGLPPRQQEDLSRADREVMRKEIEGKILNRTRLALAQLQKYEDIRIHMANSKVPRAIGMPASLLFNAGTEFKREATKILETLADMAFSLGATQLVLLPERATIGDAKILDMRRTMAISAQLTKAGVAPARVRVNLLANQVDLPKEFQDYQGMILSFVYNQPLILATDAAIDGEGGPPTSIGISPTTIDPRRGEGAIIEFSVVEPPTGLMSWRFQLRGPGKKASDEKVVLQEVKGSGPVFHQIYWNGRKNYFGETVPGGRYEGQLTATDMKNRTRTRREWITVEGLPPAAQTLASASLHRRSSRAGPPPSELGPKSVTIGGKKRRSRRRPHSVALVKKKETPPPQEGAEQPQESNPPAQATGAVPSAGVVPESPSPAGQAPAGTAPAQTQTQGGSTNPPATAPANPPASASGAASGPAGAAKTPETGARASVVNISIPFTKNTTNIVGDGEATLGTVSDSMALYPLDSVKLVGIAGRGETNPEELAAQRANRVADILVKRFNIDAKRIQKDHKVRDDETYKVDVFSVPGK